jgi:hypothetical protein
LSDNPAGSCRPVQIFLGKPLDLFLAKKLNITGYPEPGGNHGVLS